MTGKDLSKQIAATYRMLRLGLAALAFGLPLVLWFGGLFFGMPLGHSLSAYYHLGPPDFLNGPAGLGVLRNVFVGVLFAVSGFLLTYQGFTKLEDYALNAAGVLAVGVALFPMAWPETSDGTFSLHGACAVAFFVMIGYVCIFRAGDTLPLIKDDAVRDRYRRGYRYLGVGMVALPFMAWALISLMPFKSSAVFFVEMAGIYVFATYWTVKSREAKLTRMDEKAVRGRVRGRPQQLRDALKPMPVEVEQQDKA